MWTQISAVWLTLSQSWINLGTANSISLLLVKLEVSSNLFSRFPVPQICSKHMLDLNPIECGIVGLVNPINLSHFNSRSHNGPSTWPFFQYQSKKGETIQCAKKEKPMSKSCVLFPDMVALKQQHLLVWCHFGTNFILRVVVMCSKWPNCTITPDQARGRLKRTICSCIAPWKPSLQTTAQLYHRP